MPTERWTATRAEIDKRIQTTLAAYPAQWQQMIDDWRQADKDAAWLMYAANYLFHTADVRWAIDPYLLFSRLNHPHQTPCKEDLRDLQLVVLTHAHADHLDLKLIADLQNLPITWVIPAFMLERIMQNVSLQERQVRIPVPGEPIQFDGLTLVPFEGLHIHDGQGVPEMGYRAEFNRKSWLFPGDIRVFEPARLPDFGHLDGVFAHLWLGKACALHSPPPLLEEFCAFFASLHPDRMAVSHLEELGRTPEDFWTESHYQLVANRMASLAPETQVQMVKCSQGIGL